MMRWIHPIRLYGLLLISLLPIVSAVGGEPYPPVSLSNQDIRIINSPRLETDLIRHLIQNAKSSIRLGTFHFQPDENIGWPILKDLQAAAEKGIKVKFISSYFSGWNGDPLNFVASFLDFVSTYTSLEYSQVGSSMNSWFSSDWFRTDSTHTKQLIIDEKITLVTGRGYGHAYQTFFDLGYLFKGKHPKELKEGETNLVRQSVEAYDVLWEDIQRINPANRPKNQPENQPENQKDTLQHPSLADPKLKAKFDAYPTRTGELSLNEEKAQLQELITWIASSPVPLTEKTDQDYEARIIHHRFLNKMSRLPGKPKHYDYAARLKHLEDPIVTAIIERIRHAKHSIRIMSLAMMFHPEIKAALLQALKNHVAIEIITNSKQSHSLALPWWSLRYPSGYYLSLANAEEMMREADSLGYSGLLSVFLFQGSNSGTDFIFTHAKLVIVDDVTFFGSHNLTTISTVAQEEMQWEVKSAEFSNQARKIFEDAKKYTIPWEYEQVRKDYEYYGRSTIQQRLSEMSSWLF